MIRKFWRRCHRCQWWWFDSDDNNDDGEEEEDGEGDEDEEDANRELFDEIGVLVASLPPFPQIWTDGQFTIHRKAIKIKQDFSISLQYGKPAQTYTWRHRPGPDTIFMTPCISTVFSKLYFWSLSHFQMWLFNDIKLIVAMAFSRLCKGLRSWPITWS